MMCLLERFTDMQNKKHWTMFEWKMIRNFGGCSVLGLEWWLLPLGSEFTVNPPSLHLAS